MNNPGSGLANPHLYLCLWISIHLPPPVAQSILRKRGGGGQSVEGANKHPPFTPSGRGLIQVPHGSLLLVAPVKVGGNRFVDVASILFCFFPDQIVVFLFVRPQRSKAERAAVAYGRLRTAVEGFNEHRPGNPAMGEATGEWIQPSAERINLFFLHHFCLIFILSVI